MISVTLSGHFSLSFIASGRSSGLHPVSSQRYCMYVRAGRSAFAQPYVGVHRSTSHELVSASPAVSCVSGSSNLDSFRDERQVAVQLVPCGVLPPVVQYCSTFLCNCHLAPSPAVLLASKLCIHTAVSIRPLPGRNYVSFHRSGLTSIWSIAYR